MDRRQWPGMMGGKSAAPAPTPPEGRWQIYGTGLAGSIQHRFYCQNAARLLKISIQDTAGVGGAGVLWLFLQLAALHFTWRACGRRCI